MQAFFTWFDAFLSSGSFWVYIVIFFGKVLEVSLCTLRIVLINRGERVKGSLIAIIEITLWLIIASSVLDGWKNDIGKAISYALAYAGGVEEAVGSYRGHFEAGAELQLGEGVG